MVERTGRGTSILRACFIVRVPTKPQIPRQDLRAARNCERRLNWICAGLLFKSTGEIYTSVTRQLLIRDQHLELLSAVQFAEERANLPPLVADWPIRWVCSPLSPPNFDGSASYFAAGESRSSIENIGDPNKLCIPGILMDVIKETLSADRDFQQSQRQNTFQI
jgi:hypothetical protein